MKGPVTKPEGTIHIHLLVSDMKRSIDFYTTVLGFFYDHGIREMAWLKRDNMLLTLSPGESGKAEGPSLSYFGWGVDSAETLMELYDKLYQRSMRLSAAPDADEGRLYFFLYDPDDHPIGFSWTPMDYPEKS